jgi:hypothetical protein
MFCPVMYHSDYSLAIAKAARNQKSKMWIKYRNSRQYKDLVEYKKVQNKAVKEYRKAKRNFERKLP